MSKCGCVALRSFAVESGPIPDLDDYACRYPALKEAHGRLLVIARAVHDDWHNPAGTDMANPIGTLGAFLNLNEHTRAGCENPICAVPRASCGVAERAREGEGVQIVSECRCIPDIGIECDDCLYPSLLEAAKAYLDHSISFVGQLEYRSALIAEVKRAESADGEA